MKTMLKNYLPAIIFILALSDFCKAEDKSIDDHPIHNVTNQSS